MPQPRRISGRPVMITGAASGIGRELALRLSRLGSPVAIADINETELHRTAAMLSGTVLTRVLDVRDAVDLQKLADEVRAWLPAPLAAVFNNAGVELISSVQDTLPEDEAWLYDINFRGVVNGTRAFLPILLQQGEGVIVNTSSMLGLLGMPYQSAYCAAKFAVRGYTDALHQELRGTGVGAVAVYPGAVATNILRNARIHRNSLTGNVSKDELAAQFEAGKRIRSDKAAKIIHRGVERGKTRILVGPDAYLFDALARITPTHCYSLMERFLPRQWKSH